MAAACVAVVTAGAQPDIVADRRAGRNVINLAGGFSFGIQNVMGPFGHLEYAHNIKGKFWVGGRLNVQNNRPVAIPSAASACWGDVYPSLDRYWSTIMYGIGYWELPVTRKWLSFRVGGGIGLGLHFGEKEYIKNLGVAPYFLIRAEWVWHITKHFGMTFSPLLIGPVHLSRIEWSPIAPINETGLRDELLKFDAIGYIGFYVRF